MMIELSDVTESMKEEAAANAPEGATSYHFNSGKYYAAIFGLTFEYAESEKSFVMSMTTTKDDVKLSINTKNQALICINSGSCRTVNDSNALGWFQVGKILSSAIEDHNQQVRGNRNG